jgi:hypothetical protein
VVSVLMPLVAGGSVFLTDRFDPKTFFDVVERERPTYFSAVPTIYNMGGYGSVVTINVRPQFAAPECPPVTLGRLRAPVGCPNRSVLLLSLAPEPEASASAETLGGRR